MSSTTIDRSSGHVALLTSVLVCLGAGLAIVLLDNFVRIALHVPGWRGLVMVPVLIMANRVSGRGWGATGSGLAAAGFALWLGTLQPGGAGGVLHLGPFAYLVPGLVGDTMLLVAGSGLAGMVLTGLTTNLASLAGGIMAGTLVHGPGGKAWLFHALFGALAGLGSCFLARAWNARAANTHTVSGKDRRG